MQHRATYRYKYLAFTSVESCIFILTFKYPVFRSEKFCIFEILYIILSMRRRGTEFDIPAYYHIYNRGAGKRKIFIDARDKQKFIALMARYLDENVYIRGDGMPYEKSDAKVIAYCLMGNHFHLLLYQESNTDDIRRFVKSLTSAYARYYNLRHKNSGYLFEGAFRAKRITSDMYLQHITRYIHLNPRTYLTYRWSSLPEYIGVRHTAWVYAQQGNELSAGQYLAFLESYEDRAAELRANKKELEIN